MLWTRSLRQSSLRRFSPPLARTRMLADRTIQLSPEEQQLCDLLDEFRAFVARTAPAEPQVECRIAGGWVRDKLLGLPCNDIDLALSHHTGHPFATAFSAFLQAAHPEIPIGSIAKIESNPAQSKHLETAKQDLLGLELDYVNLRKEGYTDGSRIPSAMEFGTPLEDALRRDTTINSLFYNVHARAVEDWTEKGLADLESGMIRTPLEPVSTFDDDPLRIIRCVRFASRYNFALHADIEAALQDEGLRKALRERISRERVGIEVEKMFAHPNALLSFKLIDALGIWSSIFFLPPAAQETLSSTPSPSSDALAAASILEQLISPPSTSTLPALHPRLPQLVAAAERKRLFLAAAAAPYRELEVKKKKQTLPAPEVVIKESIKLSNSDSLVVTRVYQSAESLSTLVRASFPPETERSSIGNVLRQQIVHDPARGSDWTISLVWSLIMDLLPHWQSETETFSPAAPELVQAYNTFTQRVLDLSLAQAIEAKPLLDGSQVQALLSVGAGPVLKTISDAIFTWQLDHPELGLDDCSAFLRAEHARGAFPDQRPPRPSKKQK